MNYSKLALAALLVTYLCQLTLGEEQQLSGVFYMQFATVKLSGNDLMLAMMAREGKAKHQEQIYTVQVPVRNADGDVTLRTEQRTRIVNIAPLVKKVIKLDEKSKFETLDGKELPREKVAPKFKKARQVIILQEGAEIPAAAKPLLREEALVLRGQIFITQ